MNLSGYSLLLQHVVRPTCCVDTQHSHPIKKKNPNSVYAHHQSHIPKSGELWASQSNLFHVFPVIKINDDVYYDWSTLCHFISISIHAFVHLYTLLSSHDWPPHWITMIGFNYIVSRCPSTWLLYSYNVALLVRTQSMYTSKNTFIISLCIEKPRKPISNPLYCVTNLWRTLLLKSPIHVVPLATCIELLGWP